MFSLPQPRGRIYLMLEFMRLMCEGHNKEMQLILQSQSAGGGGKTFNLVQEAVNVLLHEASSSYDLRYKTVEDIEMITTVCEFLTESVRILLYEFCFA